MVPSAPSVGQEEALKSLKTWTIAEVVSIIEGPCCLLFGSQLAFGQVNKCFSSTYLTVYQNKSNRLPDINRHSCARVGALILTNPRPSRLPSVLPPALRQFGFKYGPYVLPYYVMNGGFTGFLGFR